jgi:hypothetical protein
MIGDLRGRAFWEFERLLSVPADPEPFVERVANQFDPMRFAASALQADAKICW